MCEEVPSGGVMARRFDADGEPLSGEIPVNTSTALDQGSPTIAAAPGGGFTVAWRSDQGGVFARRFDAGGEPLSDEIQVSARNGLHPSIAPDPSGGFTIAWRDSEGAAPDCREEFSEEFNEVVEICGPFPNGPIYARRFDADGEPLSGEIPVSAFGGVHPSIAPDGSGGFTVAWEGGEQASSNSIFARRFDADGEPLGGEIPVSTTAGLQFGPAIAAAPSGGFTATWQSSPQDGSGWGIYARCFDTDGEPLGGEIPVNTTTSNSQYGPAIAAASSGGFTVAWTNEAPGFGTNDWDVYARRFDAAGTPLSGEIPVNVTTAGYQFGPAVGPADSGFTVAWGGTGGVHARRFTVDTVAPDTLIDSGPTGFTNDNTPTFAFLASEEGSTFQCRLDGGVFTACSPPFTSAALNDGAHSFEVRATDAAGNTDPSPASVSFTVDTVAPDTSIDSSPAAGSTTNDNTPSFAFSSEQGASFECRLDGGVFAACSPPFTSAALNDGAHSFEVRATDAAGNTDPSPASVSFTVDTTPPDTTIDSGPSGMTNDNTPSFAFSSEQGASFECRLDSNQETDFQPCNSPLTTSPLSDGPHAFDVRAIDNSQNHDPTPASHSFTVDTIAPDTSIDSGPPAGPTTGDNTPTFTFSSEQGASFECRLDSNQETDFKPCNSPLTTSPLSDGPHSFEVRARDAVANTDPSPASISFTVDTIPPHTTIDAGPSGSSNDNTPSFAFSSEQGASFECRLDGSDYAACISPFTTSQLSDGPHVFEVRATDIATNTDPSPASISFTVDTVAPDTHIDSGPTGPTNNPTPTFNFSSNEDGSTYECQLDGGGFAACTSPLTTDLLTDGLHSFEVRATDAAGNTDPSPDNASFTVDTVAPVTSIPGPLGPTNDSTSTFADTQPPKAKLSGTGGQIAGEPIEVEVSCAEDCAVVAMGKVLVWGAANRHAPARAAGEEERFGLKEVAKQLIAGETATLKLSPKRGKTRLKLRRLVRRGHTARAEIRV